MKTLLILAALLGSTISFANEDTITIVGDKIAFQKDSAYVSALYNKTLCKNGGQYEATVTFCSAWGKNGDEHTACLAYAKYFITQPVVSTAERCAEFAGRGDSDNAGACVRWESYPLVQSPVRNVQYVSKGGTVLKSVNVTIPNCSASK